MSEWITVAQNGRVNVPPEWEGKAVEVRLHVNTRTDRQNRALHLWFTLLAEKMDAMGLDFRLFIKKTIHIPPDAKLIKSLLWHPAQKAMYGKTSTAQLTTTEIDKVYAVVDRFIAENSGVHVDFPSIDNDRINSL